MRNTINTIQGLQNKRYVWDSKAKEYSNSKGKKRVGPMTNSNLLSNYLNFSIQLFNFFLVINDLTLAYQLYTYGINDAGFKLIWPM